ncbi:hypothetical protein B7Y94_03125 [Candidatus Saccharibacteria bacterium 32-49-12]|nr:MAG: hypothetical protein B7Y94_03125 [Candidatus Saccharibacteria bacterium 32-49-12]
MNETTSGIIVGLLILIIIEVYLIGRPKRKYETNQISMLVDTSVIMDGRVVDLAKTGFLLGQVIVPKSVLAELQLLADGADHDKRERARLGLDALKELQDTLGTSFTLLADSPKTANGVDEQLISLAKQTGSSILTLDYNLNKVAQVEGVNVLNINELAKSLRMVHLPGDIVTIELTQKGQASDQAVGYLSDGTMVVVEQGKKFIGKSQKVEIIRSLQTDAGKMMFARLTQPNDSQHKSSSRPIGKRDSRTGRANNGADHSQQEARRHGGNNQNQGKSVDRVKRPTKPQANRAHKTSAQREAELIRLVDSQN